FGLRNIFMWQTKGQTIMNSSFLRFEKMLEGLELRKLGSIIASESGKALSYGLEVAQGRGITYIEPGNEVYEGMVIGENAKEEDLEINVAKGKQLTNIRSARADEAIRLEPPKIMSLEQFLDTVKADELLEITPKSFRLRKKWLKKAERDKN